MKIMSYTKNGTKSPYQNGERWTRGDKIAVHNTNNPKKSEKITMASNPITTPEFILREGIRVDLNILEGEERILRIEQQGEKNGIAPRSGSTMLYVTRTFDVGWTNHQRCWHSHPVTRWFMSCMYIVVEPIY